MVQTIEADRVQVDEPSAPSVPEIERLRLHNLCLQRQVCSEQLNVVTLQFLQTAQPKALQERIDQLTQQINAIVDEIFTASHLDPSRYQLNVEKGIFIERSGSPSMKRS